MNKPKTIFITSAFMTLFGQSLPVIATELDISTTGLVEVEASSVNSDTNGDTSDIVIATFEYGVEAILSQAISFNVLLLAEDIGDGGGDVGVDEAVIDLKLASGQLTIGQFYTPFGAFESSFISDPLTLELAESNESAVMYQKAFSEYASVAVYLFNGDVDDDDDEINDFGASLDIQNDGWQFRIDYLSNLADSDALGELGDNVDDSVGGFAISGQLAIGSVHLLAEHIAAMDKFRAGDLGGNAVDDSEPQASNFEIAFDLGNDNLVALKLESTDEAEGLLDYEKRQGIVYSTSILEDLGFAAELINAETHSGDEDTIATLQIAAEF